jgi:hypothetical protein
VNADAHRPEDLQGKTGEAFQIVADLGLKHMDVDAIGARARKNMAGRLSYK